MYCSILHSNWGLDPLDAAQLAGGAIPYLQLEQPEMSPYIGQYPGGEWKQKSPLTFNWEPLLYWVSGLENNAHHQKLFLFHMGDSYIVNK